MAYDAVDEDAVYTCVGHPLRKDIENIVYWVLNDSFTAAYNSILDLKIVKLTLKTPITTAADDTFCNILPNFQ